MNASLPSALSIHPTLEPVQYHPAFPPTCVSSARLNHIHDLQKELGVIPEYHDDFIESFSTTFIPEVWHYEFENKGQVYLASRLGSRFLIATSHCILDVSSKIETLMKIPRMAESLIQNKRHQNNHQDLTDLSTEYSSFLEHFVLESFDRYFAHPEKDLFYSPELFINDPAVFENQKPLTLSSFTSVWKETLHYSRFEFQKLTELFHKKIGHNPHDSWGMSINEPYVNYKPLSKRLAFEGNKDRKFNLAICGKLLKKLRTFYRPEVIKTLYRIHYFDVRLANWLDHHDDTIRLYRQQAVLSQPFLIPYFHQFFKPHCKLNKIIGNAYLNAHLLPAPSKNSQNTGGNSWENDFGKDHRSKKKAFKTVSKKSMNSLFESIDQGGSVEKLMLNLFEKSSLLPEITPAYHDEFYQLIRTGIRRLSKKSPSWPSLAIHFSSHSKQDATLVLIMLIQLACLNNTFNLSSKKALTFNMAILYKNADELQKDNLLLHVCKDKIKHPTKSRYLSFKDWFTLAFHHRDPDFIAVFHYYLNTVHDSLDWILYDGETTDHRTENYNDFLVHLAAQYSLQGIKRWSDSIHEAQHQYFQHVSEESNTISCEWAPLLKQSKLALPNNIVVRELTTNFELKTQGQEQNHCVGGYSMSCLSGTSRIFSIEQNSEILSTLELRQASKGWEIAQNQSQSNRMACKTAQNTATQLMKLIKKEKALFNLIPRLSHQECVQRQEEWAAMERQNHKRMCTHVQEFCQKQHPGIYKDLIDFKAKFLHLS